MGTRRAPRPCWWHDALKQFQDLQATKTAQVHIWFSMVLSYQENILNSLLCLRLHARAAKSNQLSTVSESMAPKCRLSRQRFQTIRPNMSCGAFFLLPIHVMQKIIKYATCGLCVPPKPTCLRTVGNKNNILEHLQRHHKTEHLVDVRCNKTNGD